MKTKIIKKWAMLLLAALLLFIGFQANGQSLDKQKGKKPVVSAEQKEKIGKGLKKARQAFTENKGQLQVPEIKYYGTSAGAEYYLTNNTISYVFSKRPSTDDSPQTSETLKQRMDIALVGANPEPEIIKEEADITPTHFNFYIGKNRKNVTDVRAYTKLTYKNIYPDIDMVLHQMDGKLRYDFIVHPGGNPKLIKLKMNGAEKVKLEKDGSLYAKNLIGDLKQEALCVFQSVPKSTNLKNPILENEFVKSSFRLHKNEITFKLGKYDNTKDLIIDPTIDPQWDWSTYCGGNDADVINDIAIDGNAKVYCIGTTSTNVDPLISPGTWTNMTSLEVMSFVGTPENAFIGKFEDNGQLDALTYYGTVNAWRSTTTLCNDSDTVTHLFDIPHIYSSIADFGFDRGTAITADPTNTFLYCAGLTHTGPGLPACNSTVDDIFMVKLYADSGSTPSSHSALELVSGYPDPLWMGAGDVDVCTDIKCDPNPAKTDVYLTGYTLDSNTTKSAYPTSTQARITFPGTVVSTFTGSYQTTAIGTAGKNDAFLVKIHDNGSATVTSYSLAWGTYIGGRGDDLAYGLDVYEGTDSTQGNFDTLVEIAITGSMQSDLGSSGTKHFDNNHTSGTNYDAFIAVFTGDSGKLDWGRYLGSSSSSSDDAGKGISHYIGASPHNATFVDGSGHTHKYDDVKWEVGGWTASSAGFSGTFAGVRDAFVSQIRNPDPTFSTVGTSVIDWGKYFGGAGDDEINSIASDATGNIYATGFTHSQCGISTTTILNRINATTTTPVCSTAVTNSDAFIAKFDNTGAQQWGRYFGGAVDDVGNSLVMDQCGDIFIGGTTNSSSNINFNPNGVSSWQSAYGGTGISTSGDDGFMTRYAETNAAVGSEQTICKGDSPTIGTTANSLYKYSWTSHPGTWTSTLANPKVSPPPTVTTTYKLTMTDSIGHCSKTDSVVVHVINSCVTVGHKYCYGTIDSLAMGGGCTNDGGATYHWSPATNLSSTTVANPELHISGLSVGLHIDTLKTTLVVDSATYNCINSDTITINPLPGDSAGPDKLICFGNSASIGEAAASGHTYHWTSSPSVSGYCTNCANPTVPSTSLPVGTFTFILHDTISATTCHKVDTAIVTVSNVPTSPGLTCTSPPSSGLTCTSTPSVGYGCDLMFKPTATPTSGITFYWYKDDPGFNPGNMPVLPIVNSGTSFVSGKVRYQNTSTPDNISGTTNTWTSAPLYPTGGTPVHLYVISTLNSCWANRLDITASLTGIVAPDLTDTLAYVCQEGGIKALSSTSSSGYTYVWHRIDPTTGADSVVYGTGYTLGITDPGTYYFISTSSLGCVNRSKHNCVVSATPDQIVTPTGPITSSTTLTATSTGYSSFQWYKDGVSISGATASTYLATSAAYYQCVAVNKCGQGVGSNLVRFTSCPTATLGTLVKGTTYNIPGGSQNYTTITVNGGTTTIGSGCTTSCTGVTINSTGTLTITNGGTLNVVGCDSIVVNSGGTLIIQNGSKVFGCSGWKGIVAMSGSKVIINNGTVNDAAIGVYVEDNAQLTVSGSTFQFNYTHIAFNNASGGTWTSPSTVKSSSFYELASTTCGGVQNLNNPASGTVATQKMIYIKGINSVYIGGSNNFYLNKAGGAMPGSSSDPINAVEVYNASHTSINSSTFDGPISTACYSESGDNFTFDSNYVGKSLTYPTHPYNGLTTNQTDLCTINNNQFGYSGANSDGIGIQFYQNNPGANATTISTNAIAHNRFGIVIAPIQNPVVNVYSTTTSAINNSTSTINLQITCNAIDDNDVGIIGSGYLNNQRLATTDAGNIFYGGTYHNVFWDILWQQFPTSGSPYFKYYYSSIVTGSHPNVSTNCVLPTNKYYMNFNVSSHVPLAVTSSNDSIIGVATNTCSGTGTMFKTSSIETDSDDVLNIKVYPNPFSENFTIEFSKSIEKGTVELIDITGRIVKSQVVNNDMKLIIDASRIAPAVYILQIRTPDGKICRHNLIKAGF